VGGSVEFDELCGQVRRAWGAAVCWSVSQRVAVYRSVRVSRVANALVAVVLLRATACCSARESLESPMHWSLPLEIDR